MDLFTPAREAWAPPDVFPNLSAARELWFDYETDGKDVFTSTPVGVALATEAEAWYLPFRHAGGNLDEAQVKAYLKETIRGKTLVGSWVKFDAHVSRNWGLPFDELDVTLRDVQHQACLLKDRHKSGLDVLALELLGEQKLEVPFGKADMRRVHSSLAGPYAEQDVRLTRGVDLAQRPAIVRDGLEAVLALEDACVLPVVEMEGHGLPVDLELLERWQGEVRAEWAKANERLRVEAGFAVNVDSFADVKRLFLKLGLPFPLSPDDGDVTFDREGLLGVKHPIAALVLWVRALGSLLSKYLDKYARCQRDGVLYTQFHQLRADHDGIQAGAITGRFSSAGWAPDLGFNAQQVFHRKKQAVKLGTDRWPVRRLFRPAAGRLWGSGDARQIEYRIFADLAGNARVLAEYAANPYTDYHDLVTDLVHRLTSSAMIRDLVKNVNFAKIYGAKEQKLSRMLGKSLEETRRFLAEYDRLFPEVAPLIARVEDEIRRRYFEEGIGYVRTRLGRRRRYEKLDRLYSGLNSHIQGTAADDMKRKLVEVYRERKRLNVTMRATVHDAVECDVDSADDARKLREVLDAQTRPTRVPILWEVEVGPNWCDLEKVA